MSGGRNLVSDKVEGEKRQPSLSSEPHHACTMALIYTGVHIDAHIHKHAYFKKQKGKGRRDGRKTEGKEGKWAGISSLWAVKRKWPMVKGENKNSTYSLINVRPVKH